ncbi:hypothetical protein C7T87_20895, partial [Xanthomonas hortorum pv. hederae]
MTFSDAPHKHTAARWQQPSPAKLSWTCRWGGDWGGGGLGLAETQLNKGKPFFLPARSLPPPPTPPAEHPHPPPPPPPPPPRPSDTTPPP